MKLKVPPTAFIAAGTAKAFFDFMVYALILVPAFFVFQIMPSWTIALLPIFLFALFALGTALGLLLIPFGSLFGDIAQALPIMMGFLMYMAPVVYPPPKFGLAAAIIEWNPMTPLLMGTRDALTAGATENLLPAIVILIVSSLLVFTSLIGARVVMPHLVARMGI
ncbi:ABC transporter permease [bacterium]|nr:ABC transporter permease [bacterium]